MYQLLVWIALHGGVIQSGWAPHYSPGLMERVSVNRDMAPVACMVSSPVYPLGDWLWVYGQRTDRLLHCRVTDVSHPNHRQGHIDRRIWVELSHEVTTALCGTTKGSTKQCPVLVVKLGE